MTFEMTLMITLVKLVTTAANDAAMMNATASSTRLPRRMNALKPLMPCFLCSRMRPSARLTAQGDADDGAARGAGQVQRLRGADGDDEQRTGLEPGLPAARTGHSHD